MLKNKEIISLMSTEEKTSLIVRQIYRWSENILSFPCPIFASVHQGIFSVVEKDDYAVERNIGGQLCYPSPSTTANAWDLSLQKKIGFLSAKEALKFGHNTLLSPQLNVVRSGYRFLSFSRFYSEDPFFIGKLISSFIDGAHIGGIAVALRDFVFPTENEVIVDERTLRERYMLPFEMAVKNSRPEAIYLKANVLNCEKTAHSTHILKEILADEWRYNGAIICDKASNDNPVELIKRGLNVIYEGNYGLICDAVENYKKYFVAVKKNEMTKEQLNALCAEGKAMDESLLDEAVDGLLTYLSSFNELHFNSIRTEKKMNGGNLFTEEEMREEKKKVAYDAAVSSVVLLKNDGVLPLSDEESIAFFTNDLSMLAVQDKNKGIKISRKPIDISELVGKVFPSYLGRNLYLSDALSEVKIKKELFKKSTVAVVFFNDTDSYALGAEKLKGLKKLLKKLRRKHKKIVFVLSGEIIADLIPRDMADAVLYTGYGGSQTAYAVTDILSGKANPSGKLARTVFASHSDPSFISANKYFTEEYRDNLFVGYRKDNRGLTTLPRIVYPFGFGLSYTTFEYSDVSVTDKGIAFKVTNTGEYDGEEVVQLYVGMQSSKIVRAERELKGFEKILVKKGKSKNGFIPFDENTFRYFDGKEKRWRIEGGVYNLYLSSSSDCVKAQTSIEKISDDVSYNENDNVLYSSKNIASRKNFKNLLNNGVGKGEKFEYRHLYSSDIILRAISLLCLVLLVSLLTFAFVQAIVFLSKDKNPTFIFVAAIMICVLFFTGRYTYRSLKNMLSESLQWNRIYQTETKIRKKIKKEKNSNFKVFDYKKYKREQAKNHSLNK